ncbi:UDP-N-acetylmuramoyl-L-alanine--D-glutamate ligase [Marinimicrobium sp. ABcell2]|uniref:UDP-N-acetylmuramoyl-L-alanine--D-glutamate ligase n=1 Tax=Marinimicrobium sp. ABcell2 TaxID=3069751 RepID=UPI0027B4AA20|nr:UDP-N-acetylmuramoyl-L-alanine--D-glutamate ligase [Marinimicrobium sp. ABcell2]MDQ2075085.1 UDP-N-acetylmuramoyl-L-alanine--D-glutamate ligase [Marinimicrobium sp. ABcell2]
MSGLIATSQITAIVGAGVTGLSVARFLVRQAQPFVIFDTREDLANAEQIRTEFGSGALELGELKLESLSLAHEVVVSPGVPLSSPVLLQAAEAGVPLIGDIELFARHAKAPVVAITGSNAKSTVTTLVAEMAKRDGVNVAVGGNIGVGALDLLHDSVELYVLELSSFQLESVSRLNASVACILNVSADHMDRYSSLQAYHAAKLRIYYGAQQIVVNRRDVLTQPPLGVGVKPVGFGGKAEFNSFGLLERDGGTWLAWQFEPLMPASALKIKGTHNVDNALAALAIGHAAGLKHEAMLEALRAFTGLPHRCEWIRNLAGVDYFNDSKGTNVGATLAAIEGLSTDYDKLVLIAGGEGKGADFSPLKPASQRHVRAVVLIGKDADRLAQALASAVQIVLAKDMADAVSQARLLAQSGDAVLLSPACASFDMFNGYEHRGQAYCAAVKELVA